MWLRLYNYSDLLLLSSWVLKGLKLIKPGGAVTEMISPSAAGRRWDTTSLTSILTNAHVCPSTQNEHFLLKSTS